MAYRVNYVYRSEGKENFKSKTWRITFEKWENGSRKRTHLKREFWNAHGFAFNMSFEEAQSRAEQLNATVKEENLAERKFKIQERIEKDEQKECIHLPKSIVESFEQEILFDKICDADEERAKSRKIFVKWRTAKRMIREVGLPSETWADKAHVYYRWIKKNKYSLDYTRNLIYLLNLWGQFYSKKTSKFYEVVGNPKGLKREEIADAFNESGKTVKESLPLTPALLERAKSSLSVETYNWLYLSLWCGLRPSEVDSLKNPKMFKFENDGKVILLHVYQSKLKAISSDKRWKIIPLVEKEQKIVPHLIKEGLFHRPLVKIIKKYIHDELTCYGGRKGFTDLMLGRKYLLEDVASWLGHKNIETTWKHYKNKQIVHYRKAG